ncbi:hypothetical protein K458DRAFT_428917 [Lentithecium fluviatile CBS 122367]|uniref:Sister chromatid cohesion protein n=1 Tax=Lentithecium fluviatile CBS 122367 TaxID=1168545 RepID=A0A6G1JDF5_9PLEO|nr:hypothetical protein K458DRAFT_428917 [Lentithecium fluviatile CBS 122367]
MAAHQNGDWHNANGGGLPFRPPTVDEALPYSPFTSVVPFSADIIPFPLAEPPTPPTTLSADQQTAARKAVGILNEEIKGPTSTAQHLENTLRELRDLLGNPHEMPEYQFKPNAQLATPPPDSPDGQTNGATPTKVPALSSFARLLLRQTEVHYLPEGGPSPQKPRVKQETPRQAAPAPPPFVRTPSSQPVAPSPNHATSTPNGAQSYAPSTPASSANSGVPRSGPAVVVKPLPSSARREEYRRYDHIPANDGRAQQQREGRQQDSGLSMLRPQERELAEQKIHKLQKFAKKLSEEKEDPDQSEYFTKISCLDSDLTILSTDTLNHFYDRIMVVCATGCFSAVSVDTVLRIQSLCEPSFTATDQSALFSQSDLEAWGGDLQTAESGLKAAKLVLTSMLEGREDRRITPEDLVIAIIDAMKRVLELCIFPVLGSRRSGESPELFACASRLKDKMLSILRLCAGVLHRLASVIEKVSLSDSAVNPIEYLALALLVQQNSDSEKDSVLGIQRFENLRQEAMEVLIQIFASHADHQQYIISEILNNLEKLPDKGANVRQFKSPRDPPIMAVSALFMRFVQVAATHQENQHRKVEAPKQQQGPDDDEGSDFEADTQAIKKVKARPDGQRSAKSVAQGLMANANGIAQRIGGTLAERALNVSKTGDKPFRNLLDMFVEDFCNVLGSPEWPAASIVLEPLLARMFSILKSQPNRDMALAMLGTMGCGIIDFKLRVKRLKRELDMSQSELSARLDQLTEDALDNGIHKKDLLGFKGPYRMVIESLPDYLKVEPNQDDSHLQSVRGCYVTQWLDFVGQTLRSSDVEAPPDQTMSDLEMRLETMILDPQWLSREYKFHNVADTQSRLAAGVITLQQRFCQYFSHIVNTMLSYTQETAATLKSRAIKNIESFLNKDPQAMPEKSVMGVINLLRDNSPLVRADAVSLVSKCLEGNPGLERHCLQSILGLTTDPSNNPKKKAINLLKKIYLNSNSNEHKLGIIASLLLPSQDHEKSIAEMAHQALEEIWLKPLGAGGQIDENQVKLGRVQKASLLVQTVRRIQGQTAHLGAFEKFFADALAIKGPNATAHFDMCKDLVADMVEGVISPEFMVEGCSQEHVLQTLSILTRVRPSLISQDQLQLLKLYVKDPVSTDDLDILRPTVTIFRFVLPRLPNLQADFANEVWLLLSKIIPKLASWAGRGSVTGKSTLVDVMWCTKMITPLATNGFTKLISLISSTLLQLQPFSSSTQEAATPAESKISSYLVLVGTLGKICNIDNKDELFRNSLSARAKKLVDMKKATAEQLKDLLNPSKKAPSVILLETVRPFTKQSWSLTIREHALCSVGEICQGAPGLFMRADVEATFRVVFKNDIPSLKRVALTQFYDFFIEAEKPSDHDSNGASGEESTAAVGRLGITFVAGDGQLTTNYLARKFLLEIVDIALNNDNELALFATNIITSISRQGLVHPKECGPALIALGSSSNAQIAQNAAVEHKKIHDAHESMFEKEYMSAIRMAFDYQRAVFKDEHGMIASTYKPKLLHVFNVLKGGNRKTLKKFIDNLCKQIDFELPKLKEDEAGSTALLFARFCLENLALFDVPKLEDIALILNALESIVLKITGPSVAVAIETELPKKVTTEPMLQLPQPVLDPSNGAFIVDAEPGPPPLQEVESSISDARLLQITRACMILQMMWETRCFVRKAYNLGNLTGRIPHKDFQKPALRNNLISGKELWERLELIYNSLNSRETMMKRCYEFAELLELDKDAQFGDEEADGDDPLGYVTPDEGGDETSAVPTSGRGRKRKSTTANGNTPKKARGRQSGGKNKKRNSKTPELDGWD